MQYSKEFPDMFNQGDVVSIKFPFTDGSDFKKRPVVIISNETIRFSKDYLVVQITTKDVNDTCSIKIMNTECDPPLPFQSFVRTYKVFTVHESLILKKISHIQAELLQQIINRFSRHVQIDLQ